jgi:ubiquinone/menaquinone biosynthesis C-methylase UbiE
MINLDSVPNPQVWTLESLKALDKSYEKMHRLHEKCHIGLITELGELRRRKQYADLLEVGCGTGWNIPQLLNVGFDYCGMDLSETAVSVSMMKHPESRFINCSIERADFVSDKSFDVVLSSSMLEHLADYRIALREMIRIARNELYVTFFEGLKAEGEDEINLYPFNNPDYKMFGAKFSVLQSSYGGNYYWNRYTMASIEGSLRKIGANYELLTKENRPYLESETILHVSS